MEHWALRACPAGLAENFPSPVKVQTKESGLEVLGITVEGMC